jgi:acetoin utilization protein AcuB
MVSILTSYANVPEGFRKVYIRMYGLDRSKLPALKEELAQVATLLYLVDHRENRREIFSV